MTATKTNERPGTKAVLRHFHMSASKARVVLNLIRGKDVQLASEILNNTEREAADVIAKVLASAVANAVHNDGQSASELYVAAAYADEGTTMKRWRPRARGRARDDAGRSRQRSRGQSPAAPRARRRRRPANRRCRGACVRPRGERRARRRGRRQT